jgi:phage minor structural protein
MLEVFDLTRKRVAVLQNAHNITETVKLNGVSEMTFDLPANDEKIKHCEARRFVRYGGDMYRIIDYVVDRDDASIVQYQCEHAVATLVDTVLFQDHILEGYTTRECMEYILSKQSDWVLDECDFTRYFHYAWTSENLLAALWSIPNPFTDYYQFTFDTSSYPWRISLKRIDIDDKPEFYVFAGLNFLRSQKVNYGSRVVTRLYCLGYGEGVNQLGIESINDGLPYIQAPQSYIDQYGLVESVFTDRRYEDVESLKAAGESILAQLQQPLVEYTIDVADLYGITGNDLYNAKVGKIVMFKADNYKTYITETTRNYDTDEMTITVANKPSDIATTIADLADRQRIESTYSQGATQLWGSPLQDNASPSESLVYKLWIPQETKIINKVMARIELGRFRAYSKSTASGGGYTQTSASGGGSSGTTQTSSAGGSVGEQSKTSASGGGETATSDSNSSIFAKTRLLTQQDSNSGYYTDTENGHRHQLKNHYHNIESSELAHNHNVTIKSHTHTFTTPAIEAHTHTVNVPGAPSHSHSVDIPSHRHDVEHGIFYANVSPTNATVTIGDQSFTMGGTSYEGDITQYLIDGGSIPRGRFIDIKVTPDALAYIAISIAAQGFIQSKGGGQY